MSGHPFVVLSDGTVTLRCLDLDDAPAYLAGEDPDQVRWLNEGHASSLAGIERWIGVNRQDWFTGGPRRHFGIRDARSDELIGNVEANLRPLALAPGEVNISYAVFPAWRGNGVAARAVLLICDWLRQDLANDAAVIRVDPENVYSHRVPIATGFTEAGVGVDGLVRYERPLAPCRIDR